MSADETLAAQARGEISAHIALARLILAGERVDGANLAAAPEVEALAKRHRARLAELSRLAALGVSNQASLEAVGALFDDLAERSPEAAVAFYSLGDPDELSRATEELLTVIRSWSPRGCAGRVVDVGCGIGRLAIPLTEAGARVLGLDVSERMVAEARKRAGERDGLSFEPISGVCLPAAAASADLVLVADCMPYVVDAGEADPFIAEAARTLAPGGDLLVFNWSYRDDLDEDVAEARRLADRHGLEVLRAGERPFRIWDGAGFHLRRGA